MQTLSPLQCLLGRAALGWSASELAAAADLATNTITRFERGESPNMRVQTRRALRDAMEAAGVLFIEDGYPSTGGGEGVRLARRKLD